MKKNITFILLTLVILIGCKKNESETEVPINTEPTYSTFDGSIWKNDNSTIVTSDNNLIISGNANYDNNWTLIKITKSGEE